MFLRYTYTYIHTYIHKLKVYIYTYIQQTPSNLPVESVTIARHWEKYSSPTMPLQIITRKQPGKSIKKEYTTIGIAIRFPMPAMLARRHSPAENVHVNINVCM